MRRPPEFQLFALVLSGLVVAFFHQSLLLGKVLSPADVVFAQASFAGIKPADYEPANRLLMDPVLQFQPWIEFNRTEIRQGRLPLWNPYVGCGAPHLANGQSAVFDPFQLLAYFGKLPDALAWMAAARLLTAGLGMFLLARAWGLGVWGRWFAGLTFPFGGFLVVWLLYPVANVAIWTPWAFLASTRLLEAPSRSRLAGFAVATTLLLLGGHVQTSAHVLLALGLHLAWRVVSRDSGPPISRGALAAWALGLMLGVSAAAVQIIPEACYLSRSPVWGDRLSDREPFWSLGNPRLADLPRLALPYVYGSQRRGQPNLAPVLGAQNLNESAGGFAGLATLIWLAPLGWSARKHRPIASFLGMLTVVGVLASFAIPPLANLLRILPILDVIDHRRLTLWVAFGLCLLGGIGLDGIREGPRHWIWRAWTAGWVVGAVVLVLAALVVLWLGPRLLPKAIEHYQKVPEIASDPDRVVRLARRQVHNLVAFLPIYYGLGALRLVTLGLLVLGLGRDRRRARLIQSAVVALTIADLFGFGMGLNPAIPRADDRPTPPLIHRFRNEFPPTARFLAIGEELPPNLLMRYGLSDCRNYDSVELSRSLDYFEPLYEPEPDRSMRSSRRRITWNGVLRGLDRLRGAGVAAVVASTPPPSDSFGPVTRLGRAWIAPIPGAVDVPRVVSGEIRIDARASRDHRRVVPVTFDPGWRASLDGQAIPVQPDPDHGAFLSVRLPAGRHELILCYDPVEARFALAISGLAAFGLASLLLADIVTRFRAGKKAEALGCPRRTSVESNPWAFRGHSTGILTEGRDADGPLHV